jgi:hypothetical protein
MTERQIFSNKMWIPFRAAQAVRLLRSDGELSQWRNFVRLLGSDTESFPHIRQLWILFRSVQAVRLVVFWRFDHSLEDLWLNAT